MTQHADSRFQVTEAAANRVKQLIASEGKDGLRLRVAVSGGGCSGFQYEFSLDADTGEDDHIYTQHGVDVVVDDASLDLLAGSQLDYVNDLMAASFQISNPNATATCGCGTSFAI
jgi:iron-sulfur cluster insertion protein